ncbi:MAG: molecular chaperone GrpE [Parcubacteria group bacterium Gr01-1014_8]|nr:MAG: molecular chaperone GrpE [Parcubacteria group bacterium Gr01-1014_8]
MDDDDLKEDIDFEPEDYPSRLVDDEAELSDLDAAKAKLKKLRDELAQAKKERQEFLDGWQRCKADAVNQKKEAESMVERASTARVARLIEALIPALDSFDMASLSPSWQTVDATWRAGLEGIKAQLESALESASVVPFGKPGEKYDPTMHDIVQEVDEEGEPGTVARIVRRGWKLGGRILRPAHITMYKLEG